MVRGGKVVGKSNFKKRVRSKDEGSDDSDEDYVVSEGNEESEEDAEYYCSSLDECASEEDFGRFVDEEEEEDKEVREVVRSKHKRISSAKHKKIADRKSGKRKCVSDEEDEDEDYRVEEEEEEEEVRVVFRSKDEQMSSAMHRKIADRKSQKQKCVSDEEDENVDYEEVEEKEKEVRVVFSSKDEWMSPEKHRKIADRKSRKRMCVSDEEDEDEDYDDDDDDDEEEEEENEDDDDGEEDEDFTPDEEDCLDEEEELTVRKKKNSAKVSNQGLRKNGSSKYRRRKKSAISKKPLRKRGRKKLRLKKKKRTEKYDDDDYCDSIDEGPVVRKKSRINVGRRKKTCVVQSDSDFASASSDFEYTISEEEREQIREARELCGSSITNLRSSSTTKIIEEDLDQHKRLPGRKGKEKVEEAKPKVIKQVCGICLSEEDKRRLRGTLNCCSHYFCFTCIMEWSKVESRCPLCKQRFETITKPSRSTAGVDLRDVVIQVPKRDQVYQPSEEELRSYLDPYENVICSECHHGGDDGLMLLCDLCDSSAHTYCVGLGREVPEGNWYCNGCRPVALGSSTSEIQDSLPDQRTINNIYNRLSPILNVGDSLDSIVVPSPRTPGFVGISSPRFPSGDIPPVSPGSGVGAPTLTGRRWLHRQIQNLRTINRMNLMASRTDGTSNAYIDLVNSHMDQSRETSLQLARTQDMGSQHQSIFEEMLQDDPSSSLQGRDFFSSRLGHLRRQAVQDPSTTTFNTSVNLTLWPELADISSNEQLQRCSNGSNTGPDGCGLPFPVREGDNFSMAREQLQTMVRSHLKALSKDIELDSSTFKDIATSSMHTLMSACGLEHRSEVLIVPPSSNCTHIERVAEGQMSLMKGCCLTCFDSFVKDVVKRIMDTRSRQWLSLGL